MTYNYYRYKLKSLILSYKIKVVKKERKERPNILTGNLKIYFPQAMAQALNEVEFDSVSVLVLQSLLFPQSYMRVRSRRGRERGAERGGEEDRRREKG